MCKVRPPNLKISIPSPPLTNIAPPALLRNRPRRPLQRMHHHAALLRRLLRTQEGQSSSPLPPHHLFPKGNDCRLGTTTQGQGILLQSLREDFEYYGGVRARGGDGEGVCFGEGKGKRGVEG